MDAVSSRLWPESDRLCWFPAGWDLDAQAAGVNVFFLYFYYANNRNGGIPFEKKNYAHATWWLCGGNLQVLPCTPRKSIHVIGFMPVKRLAHRSQVRHIHV